MRIPDGILDDIRARLPLSEVVGRRVSWDRRKSQPQRGDFWACCPFHQEKSPSFHVDDRKGFYHCFAAETGVITDAGIKPIAEMAGGTHRILTRGGAWVDAPFKSYGTQRLWRIALSRNGVSKVVHATAGHRWFVRGAVRARVTTDLRPGDRLQAVLPPPRTDWTLDPEGVTHGIVFGDGTLSREVYGTVNLHGEKRDLAGLMVAGTASEHGEGNTAHIRIYGGRAYAHMKRLPEQGAQDSYLLGFLAGLLATDGHVAKDGTVILNNADKAVLHWVRDTATRLGIGTYGITTQRRRGIAGIDSDIHRIHFVPSTLHAALFLKGSARDRFQAHGKRFDRLRWSVVSVEETDRVEEVFCAEVPGEHAFALEDNILTGNCFGCGASGDHVRFVMETEGASFPEAVERLAGEAGVTIPAADPASARREEARRGLAEVVALAADFFEACLRSPAGLGARAYAERRNLSAETMREFRIGWAPAERDALKRHLSGKGVPEALMEEAGLIIRPDDGRPAYDRFRNRLMIPIHDLRGRVVAFGGRALAADQEPKYLNSPETPLFQKRTLLFNAHRAREAARAAGSIVVVEGYLDAIAVFQAGIRGVVATLGTAFTEDQVTSLWRLAPEPVICFDGDKAGISAAHRAVDRILPLVGAGRSFNFAFLPDGKDPDELIATGGADRFLAEVKAASPLFDVLFEREAAGVRLDTPERRAALEKRFDDLIGQIRDERVARGYRVAVRVRLSELFGAAGAGFGEGRGRRGRRDAPPPAAVPGGRTAMTAPAAEPTRIERLVLGLLVEYPWLLAVHGERIAATPLKVEAHRRFRDLLVSFAEDAEAGGLGDRLAALDGALVHVLRDVHGGGDRRAGERLREAFALVAFHPSEDFVERYFVHLLDRIDLNAVADDLAAAVERAGSDPDEAAWERVLALKQEIVVGEEAWTAAERDLADEARAIRAAYGATGPADAMA